MAAQPWSQCRSCPPSGHASCSECCIAFGACLCVTAYEWAGFDHAAALKDIASALPELQHRVVIGADTDGDGDFPSLFEDTPWEKRHPVVLDDAVEDPDRVAMLMFTSGTSGEPKGALHTQNTL